VSFEPAFAPFAARYQAGAPQVVWTRVIDDLETPVSAFLKIGHGRPYAFLFESVEGGAWRGRGYRRRPLRRGRPADAGVPPRPRGGVPYRSA
jgi:hypothetical protein